MNKELTPTSDISIKKIEENEREMASELVLEVFMKYEAPDYTQEGVDEFCKTMRDESFLSALCIYGAFLGEELVGVIATRSEGKHIALFFVDGKYHRRGIGRQLFQTVRTAGMTVNSSPYAVGIYKKLGFEPTDTEQVVHGLRFTPMILNESE